MYINPQGLARCPHPQLPSWYQNQHQEACSGGQQWGAQTSSPRQRAPSRLAPWPVPKALHGPKERRGDEQSQGLGEGRSLSRQTPLKYAWGRGTRIRPQKDPNLVPWGSLVTRAVMNTALIFPRPRSLQGNTALQRASIQGEPRGKKDSPI